jgi:hypothetical protein
MAAACDVSCRVIWKRTAGWQRADSNNALLLNMAMPHTIQGTKSPPCKDCHISLPSVHGWQRGTQGNMIIDQPHERWSQQAVTWKLTYNVQCTMCAGQIHCSCSNETCGVAALLLSMLLQEERVAGPPVRRRAAGARASPSFQTQ